MSRLGSGHLGDVLHEADRRAQREQGFQLADRDEPLVHDFIAVQAGAKPCRLLLRSRTFAFSAVSIFFSNGHLSFQPGWPFASSAASTQAQPIANAPGRQHIQGRVRGNG